LINIVRKTTNAIFLAIVLIAGTFAAISPSYFITGVNAQSELNDYGLDDDRYNDYNQDYGNDRYDKKSYGNSYEQDSYSKDRDYDKSNKDSSNSVSLKKLKCNNINANLNNIDANFGSPPVEEGDTNGVNGVADGEALAAQGGESISANGLMNGGRDGDRSFVDRENDFAFVCINNNNNTVIEEETPVTPVEECAETDEIEACFANAEFMGGVVGFPEFVEALEAGITVEINGQDITLRSFNDICLAFEGLTTYEQLRDAVGEIEDATGANFGEGFFAVVDCIAEAIGIPIPLG
jgi:hypothetical protein